MRLALILVLFSLPACGGASDANAASIPPGSTSGGDAYAPPTTGDSGSAGTTGGHRPTATATGGAFSPTGGAQGVTGGAMATGGAHATGGAPLGTGGAVTATGGSTGLVAPEWSTRPVKEARCYIYPTETLVMLEFVAGGFVEAPRVESQTACFKGYRAIAVSGADVGIWWCIPSYFSCTSYLPVTGDDGIHLEAVCS